MKKEAEVRVMDIVLVEWIDAHGPPEVGWQTPEQLNGLIAEGGHKVKSVGFVLQADDDFITLIGCIIEETEKFNPSYDRIVRIPKACIKKLIILRRTKHA